MKRGFPMSMLLAFYVRFLIWQRSNRVVATFFKRVSGYKGSLALGWLNVCSRVIHQHSLFLLNRSGFRLILTFVQVARHSSLLFMSCCLCLSVKKLQHYNFIQYIEACTTEMDISASKEHACSWRDTAIRLRAALCGKPRGYPARSFG